MAAVEFIEVSAEMEEEPEGFSFFPWRGHLESPPDLLRTFHLLSIRPGHERGNHFHPGHREWLYPFHGAGVLLWQEPPGKVREREVAGGRTLIHVAPGVVHVLRNPGPEIIYLLAWREAEPGAPGGPETVDRPVRVE